MFLFNLFKNCCPNARENGGKTRKHETPLQEVKVIPAAQVTLMVIYDLDGVIVDSYRHTSRDQWGIHGGIELWVEHFKALRNLEVEIGFATGVFISDAKKILLKELMPHVNQRLIFESCGENKMPALLDARRVISIEENSYLLFVDDQLEHISAAEDQGYTTFLPVYSWNESPANDAEGVIGLHTEIIDCVKRYLLSMHHGSRNHHHLSC